MKKRCNPTCLFFFLLSLAMTVVAETGIQPVLEDPALKPEEERLLQSVQQSPKRVEALYALAEFYAQHRYYPQAVTVLENLLQDRHGFSEAHFLLGKLLGSQKTDPERSLQALQQAVALEPESVRYREELANVYHRLQRFPPALEQLEAILNLEPDNPDALYRKAVILYTQGQVDEALERVKQLPDHEHAAVLHAVILIQRGEDAQPLLEETVRRFPHNIRARYELGKIWMKQKKGQRAQEVFEHIIDEDPFYQHALFQLVKIYAFQKKTEQARLAKQSLDVINRMGRDQRNAYRSYLRHHPDTAETHFNMGIIYLEIGRGDLAAQQLQLTLERDGRHADAPFYLAQVYMSSGEYEPAVPLLEQCLTVRENKAVLHSLLTQCYLEIKDAARAKQHLQSALRLDPNEPLALRIVELLKQSSKKNNQK